MNLVKRLACTIVAAVAAMLICSPAYAIFSIQFNENGTGCILNPDNHCDGALVSTLAADPTGRVAGDVLIYSLPEEIGPGDVGITEFGSNLLSDDLYFFDNNGAGFMIFYSLSGGVDLADSGLPGGIDFIGASEDANGNFLYAPGSGTNNKYFGISSPDRVPEPVTLSLFGAGLLGAAGLRRRRKATTA